MSRTVEFLYLQQEEVIQCGGLDMDAYIAGAETTLIQNGQPVSIARYLHVAHINHVEELAIFASALFAAGIGFLWYNTYPAQVFMGDVGALGPQALVEIPGT